MSFTKTQNKFSKGIDDKANGTAVTINEAGNVTSTSGGGALTTTGLVTRYLGQSIADVAAYRTGASDGVLTFSTTSGEGQPTEKMRIDGEGNVGIGSPSPQTKLDIRGGGGGALGDARDTAQQIIVVPSSGVASMKFVAPESQICFGNNASNSTLAFVDRGTGATGEARLTINNEGNVGIGTDNPSADLHLSGSGPQKIDVTDTTGPSVRLSVAGSNGYLGTTTNHDQLFLTNDTERMRIDAAGDTTFSGNLELNSVGAEANTNIIRFQRAGYWWQAMHDPNRSSFVLESQTGGVRMRMSYDGDVQFAGNVVSGQGPLIAKGELITTLSTLRKATMDETQDIRESLRSAIDELVEGFEQQIAAMPAPEAGE